MAQPTTTIDALPAVASVTGTQLVVVQEAGVTKHATVDALAAYVNTLVQAQLADLQARIVTLESTP